ncbi:transport transmembrane protein [Bartonella clarridgeiae 73]|uniref:Transport transmembrane protein n=1 Tax=Bartonella clarridgeiae (strain CCUG 45776 / CIP 104772 / 73) TaxID=696125 RepID=E6YHK5_BARC7|nr:MFS transporter [Bartonella clarridgeiae]WCR55081.1 MAG: Transport transmembrane protein [Bartonella clarridgeiae]CBI76343.1 transport transmembrane protein [Bartonella clarridgeiae 73]
MSFRIDFKIQHLGILALAVGSFAIGTAEFVAMGLQPEMAHSSHVSISTAGQYISSYALGVVLGAPILAVVTAKLSYKAVLIGLMFCYALANIASTFFSDFNVLVILRFISGFPHGIYFGIATVVASSMVEKNERSKAVGSVMLGLTVATVIGAPSATWIGQFIGWQIAFLLVGAISLVCCFLIWKFLPSVSNIAKTSIFNELSALKKKEVWFLLAMVSIGASGLFSVFTYIKSTLLCVSNVSLKWVPFIMPLMGLGMVVGNILGPKFAIKIGSSATIFFAMLWSALVFFLFFFLSYTPLTAALGCFLIGTSFASMPSIQAKIIDVAMPAQMLGSALMQSAFNIANALGAEFGACILKLGYSYEYTAILGGILTLCGLLIFCFLWYMEKYNQHFSDDL